MQYLTTLVQSPLFHLSSTHTHLNDPHVGWDPVPQSNTHNVPRHQLSGHSLLDETATDTAAQTGGVGWGEGVRGGMGTGGHRWVKGDNVLDTR